MEITKITVKRQQILRIRIIITIILVTMQRIIMYIIISRDFLLILITLIRVILIDSTINQIINPTILIIFNQT